MQSMAGSNETPSSYTYATAGVDIDAGNALVKAIGPAVRSTDRPGTMGSIGGFGGLFDLAASGYKAPLLVAATDGVGTKLKVAIEAETYDTVGIDLVAMCVNDLVVQGAEPLFFLDYYACSHLDVAAATAVVEGIAEGCRQAGCALIGGETAEMPGMYSAGDFDLAGFSVGAVERDGVLPRPTLAEGDVILGLASSGVHSNGFSLVRRLVADHTLDWQAPAPFVTGANMSLARALLAPTRIYVKPLLAAIRGEGEAVKALAHITGGGLTENLPRVLPDTLAAHIDLSAITPPPVFGWLADLGRIDEAEMLRTFNCGIGMIVVVPAEAAESVTAKLQGAGETVTRLGTLAARDGDAMVYRGSLDLSGTPA